MSAPLNPQLYKILLEVFGKVRIADEGAKFSAAWKPDIIHPGRKKLKGRFGEYYQVCCPECRDRFFRLWINHRWGTVLDGEKIQHLFVCYNEHCEEKPSFQRWMQENLKAYIRRGRAVKFAPCKPEDDKPRPMALPAHTTAVHMLPDDHVAVTYLQERGFDPQELGALWDVRWCQYSADLPPMNKLVFPIYSRAKSSDPVQVYGYQARYLDPLTGNSKPNKSAGEVKYYTLPGTKKSRLLYNGFRAAEQKSAVIVCEGPLDVIRFGPEHAVGLFGKSPSHDQKEALWRVWGRQGAVCVIALDPDAWEEEPTATKLREWERDIRKSWQCVVRLNFPKETDAGDTPREVLKKMVNDALDAAGRFPLYL